MEVSLIRTQSLYEFMAKELGISEESLSYNDLSRTPPTRPSVVAVSYADCIRLANKIKEKFGN